MDKALIGLSLSQCIMDMIEGKVDPDDVMFIYAGTTWDFPLDLEPAAWKYAQSEWSQDPELGRKLLFDLWEEGRIIQPGRTKYKVCMDDPDYMYRYHCQPNISRGHWAIQVRMP